MGGQGRRPYVLFGEEGPTIVGEEGPMSCRGRAALKGREKWSDIVGALAPEGLKQPH